MTDGTPAPRQNAPSRNEFIALMAMMLATVAFSIDAMLPSLPEIGEAMSPDNINRVQLVITSFVLGMGMGTFLTGPLSDALGRKPVIIGGAAVYIAAAAVAAFSQRLEVLLLARLVQGFGAAGPRVVALAIIRDLYAGRGMAQIMSFVMMVFTLVPALAPTIGNGIIALAGWRAVFGAFVIFSLLSVTWLTIRLPETLPKEQRRAFQPAMIGSALREIFAHPVVRLSLVVQTLTFGMMFAFLSSTQQIFDVTFDRGETFHLWFGGIAVCASSASFLNAVLVMRLGMRFLVTTMLKVQVCLTGTMVVLLFAGLHGLPLFAVFVIWQTSIFFQAGLSIGNLNAIAMEPMGHIAGMAASIIGAISTILAVVLGAPIGLAFDGTPRPLAVGILLYAALALLAMLRLGKAEERMGTH
ncbi:multidrug effflux MFS transporter [Allosediminivita pacifica]|uniref:DHA1 family bicyclomycin/chloramphenicol resistance-like MFS transporter n=1 Tax=Allosediminivita pacifica TaxID=1267769 RepID=A0A2T6AW42_9RHOB|nr:multidrug effflux MFS transporter [Allosediminivita pacifica]PTX48041.1 DHA1 family bicyclomycin/chloramphenicol resistance-like MFS transporter [Allosediminivita pacifica]GGB11758.1 MFS transporter [Allosediminivita pacifica]